ncbi:hypothetical protein [Haladaptatus sp. NG-WS-4]
MTAEVSNESRLRPGGVAVWLSKAFATVGHAKAAAVGIDAASLNERATRERPFGRMRRPTAVRLRRWVIPRRDHYDD